MIAETIRNSFSSLSEENDKSKEKDQQNDTKIIFKPPPITIYEVGVIQHIHELLKIITNINSHKNHQPNSSRLEICRNISILNLHRSLSLVIYTYTSTYTLTSVLINL